LGTDIQFNNAWINSDNPLLSIIPACTFPNNEIYGVKVVATYAGVGTSYAEVALIINDTDYFSVDISQTVS
jgi:hypothetical protein